MKKLIALALVTLLYISSCDSSEIQSYVAPIPENPDSIVAEHINGIEFMGPYSENLHPNLRIDFVETYSNEPPWPITKGTLLIYYNNQLADSIPYGYAYQFPGYTRPYIRSGYITPGGEYLLKIQNSRNSFYIAAPSFWYIINETGIHLLPKATTKEGNGIYENNYVRPISVKKSQLSNRIIFFGECYCDKQVYTTFNLYNTFKNFSRTRPNCYDEWQWE